MVTNEGDEREFLTITKILSSINLIHRLLIDNGWQTASGTIKAHDLQIFVPYSIKSYSFLSSSHTDFYHILLRLDTARHLTQATEKHCTLSFLIH